MTTPLSKVQPQWQCLHGLLTSVQDLSQKLSTTEAISDVLEGIHHLGTARVKDQSPWPVSSLFTLSQPTTYLHQCLFETIRDYLPCVPWCISKGLGVYMDRMTTSGLCFTGSRSNHSISGCFSHKLERPVTHSSLKSTLRGSKAESC